MQELRLPLPAPDRHAFPDCPQVKAQLTLAWLWHPWWSGFAYLSGSVPSLLPPHSLYPNQRLRTLQRYRPLLSQSLHMPFPLPETLLPSSFSQLTSFSFSSSGLTPQQPFPGLPESGWDVPLLYPCNTQFETSVTWSCNCRFVSIPWQEAH